MQHGEDAYVGDAMKKDFDARKKALEERFAAVFKRAMALLPALGLTDLNEFPEAIMEVKRRLVDLGMVATLMLMLGL